MPLALATLACTARAQQVPPELVDPNRASHVYRDFAWSTTRASYATHVKLPLDEYERAKQLTDASVEVKLREAVEYFRRTGWGDFFRSIAQQNGDLVHEVVMAFAQAIPYRTGPGPAWLPIETLVRGVGDCDDKAVIAVGLLRALSIDAAYWNVVGVPHASVAIARSDDNASGVHTTWSGRKYFYWEATRVGARPGEGEVALGHPVQLLFPSEEPTSHKRILFRLTLPPNDRQLGPTSTTR